MNKLFTMNISYFNRIKISTDVYMQINRRKEIEEKNSYSDFILDSMKVLNSKSPDIFGTQTLKKKK